MTNPNIPSSSSPNEESEIPRNSPTIVLDVGEKVLNLTWYDTLVRMYAPPYVDMTHIEVTDHVERSRAVIFGTKALIQTLMMQDYPMRLDPEPEDRVVRLYQQNQRENLDSEINHIFGGEVGE